MLMDVLEAVGFLMLGGSLGALVMALVTVGTCDDEDDGEEL